MRAPLKMVLASVAAATLLGGGTLAFWSDSASIEDRAIGTGELTLNLSQNSVGNRFMQTRLAPGQNDTRTVVIASNDGESVPNANLYISTDDVSETNTAAFRDQARLRIRGQVRAEGCGSNINGGEWTMDIYNGTFGDFIDGAPVAYPAPNGAAGLLSLAPGERVCTIAMVSLPSSAGNDTQNALVEFDLAFDLVQVGGAAPA